MALAQEPIYQRKDVYGQLSNESREIRIISLKPGLYFEPLVCDLIQTSLGGPLTFEKLSYVWGDPELVSQILVDGHELRIHASLDIALHHLRLKDAPRLLWTDAICINQANTPERSRQVAMMAQVYESPGPVLVWLGPSSDDSHLAFSLAEEIRLKQFSPDYIMESVRQPANLRIWEAFFALCQREYWNRVWTAQEIICDKEAVIMCGLDSMEFVDLAEIAKILQGSNYSDASSIPGISEAGLHRLRIQWGYQYMQGSHRTEREPDLLFLMTFFRAHHCSDPRDKVYSLAGMAKDVRDAAFPVDYDLPTGQVYLQAARWTIESTKKLNVLCCCLVPHPDFSLPKFDLPSWVPDWTALRVQNQLSPTAGYFATGETTATIEPSPDPRILTVAGCHLGNIDVISEFYFEKNKFVRLTTEMRETIQKWVGLALSQNATTTEELSPNSINERTNAFWRTLVCNRAEEPYKLDETLFRSMFDVARGVSEVPKDFLEGSLLSGEERLQRYVGPLVASLDVRMVGRRFFRSGEAVGMMGLGPARARCGDHICLLMGCDIPVLLRSEGDHYVLVGEAYVHGFMQGEADADIQSRKLTVRMFSIH